MTNGTKKGLSPLAWVGIGCGVLGLIGVVAVIGGAGFVFFKAKEVVQDLEANPTKTVAEMVVRANPDLELLSTDDEAGTITFRDNSKGEEITLDFEDLAEGNFSVTTNEGEFTINAENLDEGGGVTVSGPDGESRFGAGNMQDVPDWVPLYPGSEDMQSGFSSSTPEQVAGILSGTTTDSSEQVMEHYKKTLEDAGYEVNVQTFNVNGQQAQGVITATADGGKRSVNLTVGTGSEGTTAIGLQYNGKTE